MRVSLEWLGEYVDIGASPDELAELLSMSGTAVDRVLTMGEGVTGVVVGRVVEVREHPDADNLRIAMVEDGSMVREVVCGAPNLRQGMKSALALPGATLPSVSTKPLKRATIRGVESDGMLASSVELGVSDDATGIMELETDAPVGADLHQVVPLEDVVFDLEITPNRPDCMCMVGVAREVAALTGVALRPPAVALDEKGPPVAEKVTVVIKDPQGCPRYSARAVLGARVAPSPAWMQRRLIASGVRPISNLVDVTNYVLMELGQPLHAFDLDLIDERTIVVRLARRGEVLTTLDEVDRQLDDQSLVIADIARPVALAGIMGGEGSEVMDTTTNVLIESAHFNPTSILKTSRRLGIRSEASARFERGTDLEGTVLAARRAAQLMHQLAGGDIAQGEIDEYPRRYVPVAIGLRPERVNAVLGTTISTAEMIEILEGLETVVEDGNPLSVTVPSFRPDLEREIDLVEEIARVYGYGRIPESLPGGGGLEAGLTRRQQLKDAMVEALIAQGMMEAWTYSFMRRGDLDAMRLADDDPLRRAVELQNPLSETGELMRTNMLAGLARAAAGNVNRGNRDLALFELGRVFESRGREQLPIERDHLGVLLTGLTAPPGWAAEPRGYDYFDLKGALENVIEVLGVQGAEFAPAACPYLVQGRTSSLALGGESAGLLGQVHPAVVSAFGLDGDFYFAELAVDGLLDAAEPERQYRPISRYPSVKVDIAVIVSEALGSAEVERQIREQGGEFLRAVRLFDVYRGPQIPEGSKSLAYALEFESAERTLTDEETHRELDRIVRSLETAFEAKLRDR